MVVGNLKRELRDDLVMYSDRESRQLQSRLRSALPGLQLYGTTGVFATGCLMIYHQIFPLTKGEILGFTKETWKRMFDLYPIDVGAVEPYARAVIDSAGFSELIEQGFLRVSLSPRDSVPVLPLDSEISIATNAYFQEIFFATEAYFRRCKFID